MKNTLKIIIGAFAAIGLSYFAFVSFISLGGLSDSNCTDHQEKRVTSPSKLYVASYVQKICLPENNLTAYVNVHDNNVRNSSLVFKASANVPKLNIELEWKDNTTLVIKYPKGTNIMHTSQPNKVSSIFVIYREKTANKAIKKDV